MTTAPLSATNPSVIRQLGAMTVGYTLDPATGSVEFSFWPTTATLRRVEKRRFLDAPEVKRLPWAESFPYLSDDLIAEHDEWWQLAIYPRLAPRGVLTFLPTDARSQLLPLDIEFATWANPKSEVVYFRAGGGCC